jgi:hypothetical protein
MNILVEKNDSNSMSDEESDDSLLVYPKKVSHHHTEIERISLGGLRKPSNDDHGIPSIWSETRFLESDYCTPLPLLGAIAWKAQTENDEDISRLKWTPSSASEPKQVKPLRDRFTGDLIESDFKSIVTGSKVAASESKDAKPTSNHTGRFDDQRDGNRTMMTKAERK